MYFIPKVWKCHIYLQGQQKSSTDATAVSCLVAQRCCRATRRWRTRRRGYAAAARRRQRSPPRPSSNPRPGNPAYPPPNPARVQTRGNPASKATPAYRNRLNRRNGSLASKPNPKRLTKPASLPKAVKKLTWKVLRRIPNLGGTRPTKECLSPKRWGSWWKSLKSNLRRVTSRLDWITFPRIIWKW